MKAVLSFLLGLTWATSTLVDDPPPFDGEWRTTIGLVKLSQKGDDVTGTYGNPGQFPLKGSVKGKTLTFEYTEGAARGNGQFTLDNSGNAFTGGFQVQNGQGGVWNGWRPDPSIAKGEPGKFAGLWLTDLGLMELEQTEAKVKGRYALRGTSALEGDVSGRRLYFRSKGFRNGTGWFDLDAAGKAFNGAAQTEGFNVWFGWKGRPAPEFVRHVKLVPGKVVEGSTDNLLSYSVRAPEGFEEKGGKKWPTVVILHGSNMNGSDYVNTIAAAWPDIARDFLLIGINGEIPSNIGQPPQFNYSYVNFVGKSTFGGFPGTDRESPALVSEALTELKGIYPVGHYLVGGHSQGGFLTYSLLMNYPELLAGAFPVSCGLIMQCEPDAYNNLPLRERQRAVPLAIVHGKIDLVVAFSTAEYAATLFGEESWHALRFFTDVNTAHKFTWLPIGPAIRWLEALASNDPKVLLAFAEEREKQGSYRDAIAALDRARALNLDTAQKARTEALNSKIEEKAKAGAEKLLPLVRENKDGKWIDDFLAYRDQFEFTPASREVLGLFRLLRTKQENLAKAKIAEARGLFQQQKRYEGYAKYQDVVDHYYASPSYRNVKRWLAEKR